MWLTLATFVGYAVVYTVLLKPATPQNIVIGGASGAMPPVLGWAAVTDAMPPEALLLFLIIFIWTPPHFWSLALYRRDDYARAELPMLPVTHGPRYTQLMIVLYTVVLVAVTLMPFVIRMSGVPYLVAALALGGCFVWFAWRLYRHYSDGSRGARSAIRSSISRRCFRPCCSITTCGDGTFAMVTAFRGGALRRGSSLLLAAAAARTPGSSRHRTSPGRPSAASFSLDDHHGKPRTLADFRGKAVVVFFGYTQCPDVCPTTLATLADAMKKLGPDADRVQVLFVTVDPDRDTADVLSQYVPSFDPRFLGLRGDADATARTAKEFKVIYQKEPGTTPGSYSMDHSAGLYLYDPQGRIRVYAGQNQGADVIAHDLRVLLGAG